MKYILIGKNIKKTYGENPVLDNVDVKVEKGEFVVIMGLSGCGKSTLLFALSGTDRIDAGTVEFMGENLSNFSDDRLADVRRTKMGFIFQQPTMLRNLNMLDNIIVSSLHGARRNRKEIIAVAKDLLQRTGIADLEKRSIHEVSGGQLQRVGICRALMASPEVIFADEPTGALNSKTSAEILDLLVNINEEGTTIVLVTHDVNVAARANRVLFMDDGKIKSELKLSNNQQETNIKLINSQMNQFSI